MRIFPFNALETTIMVEERFGHKDPNDEEPLAVWMTLKMRQKWSFAMYH